MAVSALAVSTGDVTVKDNASPKKDILSAAAMWDFTIEGEAGARSISDKKTLNVEMQGDYINEDASGIPYIWQCIETQPEAEGQDPKHADCTVIRFEREVRSDKV